METNCIIRYPSLNVRKASHMSEPRKTKRGVEAILTFPDDRKIISSKVLVARSRRDYVTGWRVPLEIWIESQ